MTLPYDLNILDVVLLSVIALFTLRGALRGFLDEVAGLVGIIGGIWLAGRYYGELGRIFSQYTTSQWVYIVAYVLILCMVMFVISMVSRALHSFLKMAYADWINHVAGAAVGGLKGPVIHMVTSSPQYGENTAFFQFSPWRDPRLMPFSGYPFGVSRKKASTVFYNTA